MLIYVYYILHVGIIQLLHYTCLIYILLKPCICVIINIHVKRIAINTQNQQTAWCGHWLNPESKRMIGRNKLLNCIVCMWNDLWFWYSFRLDIKHYGARKGLRTHQDLFQYYPWANRSPYSVSRAMICARICQFRSSSTDILSLRAER